MSSIQQQAREHIMSLIQPSIVGPDAVSLELYEAIQDAVVSVRWADA